MQCKSKLVDGSHNVVSTEQNLANMLRKKFHKNSNISGSGYKYGYKKLPFH
jgi:hypothetical protein